MPLYNYRCIANDHRYAESRKINENQRQTYCPECGSILRREYSAPAIQLKGSGFYKTTK